MRKINTDIWGTEYSEYDTINARTGAEDLNDIDYENYPPFTRNNLASLGSNPTEGNFDDDAIYIGYLNGTGMINPWSPGADFDYSIAYCACINPNLTLPNTIICGVGPFEHTIDYDYNYTHPNEYKSISMQRTGNKATPIFFKNYSNYMKHRPNKSGGLQTLTGSDPVQPYYSMATAPGVYNYNKMWSPDGAMRDTAGWDSTNARNDVNINGYMSYWRDFGLRSLFTVIKIIYYDGTVSETTGIPKNVVQSPVTLHWYETQTDAWKAEHPILCAWCDIYFRRNTDGSYSSSRPNNQCFIPDLTNGLRLTSKWESYANFSFWQPIDTCYNNGNSFLPLFGVIGQGNMTASTITGVGQIGAQQSTDPTSLTGVALVGYCNSSWLHFGYPYSGSSMSPFKTCWLEMDGTAENLELLRKSAAAYGLFFADDVYDLADAGRDSSRWTDTNMCLGVVNEKGYTDGTYTKGNANTTANNFTWKTAMQSPYNPHQFNIYIGDKQVENIYIGNQSITAAFIGDQTL